MPTRPVGSFEPPDQRNPSPTRQVLQPDPLFLENEFGSSNPVFDFPVIHTLETLLNDGIHLRLPFLGVGLSNTIETFYHWIGCLVKAPWIVARSVCGYWVSSGHCLPAFSSSPFSSRESILS
jgi:hypothetical protein